MAHHDEYYSKEENAEMEREHLNRSRLDKLRAKHPGKILIEDLEGESKGFAKFMDRLMRYRDIWEGSMGDQKDKLFALDRAIDIGEELLNRDRKEILWTSEVEDD